MLTRYKNLQKRGLPALLLMLSTVLSPATLAADGVPVTLKSLQELVIYPAQSVSATALTLNDSKLSAQIGRAHV